MLVVSFIANVYFFTKGDVEESKPEKINKEYVISLENELASVKETLSSVSKNTKTSITTKSLQDLTGLEDTAIKFLEHVYNVNPENYGHVKKSARDLMSKELFKTLYGAPGINENKVDYMTEVLDIEVYQHTKEKQAIVKFKIYSKQLTNSFETEEQHTMCLYFKTQNGKLIVEAIEPLSDMGAV